MSLGFSWHAVCSILVTGGVYMTCTGEMTKRVLAIDDDEAILGVMNNVLTMHDYQAVTASHWVEALDALDKDVPDLLLLDLQMPHVDGFFLLEWIREQEIEIPVIVVSAFLDDDSVARLESLGVDDFVWKPFTVSDLIEKIEKLIGPSTSLTQGSPTTENEERSRTEKTPDAVHPTLGRKRVYRRRKGTIKHQRRRLVIYLSLIAVMSIGISGVSIYLRNVVTAVEKVVEEEIARTGDEAELLKELLRSRLDQGRRPKLPPAKNWISIFRGSSFAQFGSRSSRSFTPDIRHLFTR